MARYFEEFSVGEVAVSAERTVTESDVMNFAALTGDQSELHTDAAASAGNRYGQRIAHGAFIFAASIGLLQSDHARRPHLIALAGVERLRFVKPVFLGDTIRVRQTIRELSPVNGQSGLIEARQEVLNQDGAVTVTYTAKFLAQRTPGTGELLRKPTTQP